MSDPNVVSELIRNRMSLDVSYKEKIYPSGDFESHGGMVFNESILCAYISLDELLKDAPLTKKQRFVVNLMMRGYTVQDVADVYGVDRRRVSEIFQRAVKVLCERHEQNWKRVMKKLYGEPEEEV